MLRTASEVPRVKYGYIFQGEETWILEASLTKLQGYAPNQIVKAAWEEAMALLKRPFA